MEKLFKNNKDRVIKIIDILSKIYPDAKCSLNYKTPLQLLIATQLAAQCTDKRVNIVTENLFKKYKNVFDFANADINELIQYIKSTGFYRNKSKNIINCCKILVDNYNGNVPNNMEDLLKLPGVGRKTANVMLGEIFDIPGIIVDTHAKRLSNRIGLSKNTDPVKIEYDLMKIIPQNKWTIFSHELVFHGRAVCNSRKPKCDKCEIAHLCDYFNKV